MEAIRNNLQEIVSEEGIIMAEGDRVIKVPVRTLEQYRFRFDPDLDKHAGQGDGSSQVGDILGREPFPGTPQPGKGPSAGDMPGIDYYETEITVDQLADIVFEELGLPNLDPKRDQRLRADGHRFTDVRKAGLISNIDKKRTILEVMRRNAMLGKPGLHGIRREDLRFKTWEVSHREEANAVVVAMMDTSGSMGTLQKFVVRTFFFWMVRWLRKRYESVELVFIAHHTEAKEVSEEEFFKRGESGGTRCSSAYRLALDIVNERYDPDRYNVYAFHFSDGDNLQSDNETCLQLVRQLAPLCRLLGYGEVRPRYTLHPTLHAALSGFSHPNFASVVIHDQAGVLAALRAFFAGQLPDGGASAAG